MKVHASLESINKDLDRLMAVSDKLFPTDPGSSLQIHSIVSRLRNEIAATRVSLRYSEDRAQHYKIKFERTLHYEQ